MERMGRKVLGVGLAVLAAVLLLSPAAWAQSSSTIAGSVRNAAGVPVANVNVEVSSPALIEKSRSVTTDGQGQYRVIDLPIGVYDVTFSAAGFSTVKNVGITLPAAFTATVNGSLKAGAPSETITVTVPEAAAQAVAPAEAVVEFEGSPVKGSKDAKLTLVEFTDYQ